MTYDLRRPGIEPRSPDVESNALPIGVTNGKRSEALHMSSAYRMDLINNNL